LRADVAAREAVLREQIGSVRLAGTSAEEHRGEHLETLRELADARNRLVQCESFLQAAEARVARLKEQRAGLVGLREEAERKLAAASQVAGQQRASATGSRASCTRCAPRRMLNGARSSGSGRRSCGCESDSLRCALGSAHSRRWSGPRRACAPASAPCCRPWTRENCGRVPHCRRSPARAEGTRVGDGVGAGGLGGRPRHPDAGRAAAAIDHLKRTKAGRATFLPKSDIRATPRPSQLAELARRTGCVGVAADLVTCAPGVEPIIEHLLGRVLVMETLDAALALSRGRKGGGSWSRSTVT